MKTLPLLFALSLCIPATPSHSAFNPIIRLKTADETLASYGDVPILDMDGNELRVDQKYYIISFIWGAGGGVKPASLHYLPIEPCTSGVMGARSQYDVGIPVVFTPADKNHTVVYPSAYLTISFDDATTSKQSVDKQYSWKVDYNKQWRVYLVEAGEVDEDASKLFKIQPLHLSLNAYKLTYCPLEDRCYNVGRSYDWPSMTWQLSLSDDPFAVVFMKVGDD